MARPAARSRGHLPPRQKASRTLALRQTAPPGRYRGCRLPRYAWARSRAVQQARRRSEAAQVAEVGRVLGGDNEAELVPVIPPARQEGAAVRLVLQRRISMALLAVARHTVPLQIAQVCVGSLAGVPRQLRAGGLVLVALGTELDDNPPRPEPPRGIPLPATAIPGEGQLGAAAAGVEPPASLTGRTANPVGVAARLADCGLDLLQEGPEARVGGSGATASTAEADAEII